MSKAGSDGIITAGFTVFLPDKDIRFNAPVPPAEYP